MKAGVLGEGGAGDFVEDSGGGLPVVLGGGGDEGLFEFVLGDLGLPE
jgi:hypothetical protein